MTPVSRAESERAWIAQIQAGTPHAFDQLIERYSRDLIKFGQLYVQSREVAEEIVLDVFVNIWKMGSRWQPRGALKPYLYGAVRKECFAYQRQRRLVVGEGPALESLAGAEATEQTLRYKELRHALARTVAAFPDRRRQVFALSRYHGLTYAQIAAVLGISVKTVEKHMGLALKSLRDRLAPFLSLIL